MKMEGWQASLRLVLLLVISSFTCNSLADNGEVALARPMDQISIDGDFADWPSSLPWYSIERTELGETPQGASDLKASFRVGYDQNALYVAVKVHDDSTVTDGTRQMENSRRLLDLS